MKNLINITVLCTLLACSQFNFCQVMPQLGWVKETQLINNPSYAGTSEEIRGAAISRRQWQGIEGAPTTTCLSIDKHLGKKIGAGLDFTSDQIGAISNINMSLNGSYRLYLNSSSFIQGGIKAGISHVSLNTESLDQWDGGDPIKDNRNTIVPKIGFGFTFIHNDFYIGASAPDFVAYDTKDILSTDKNNNFLKKNYFITGGGKFGLTEFISFAPSAMIRYSKNDNFVNTNNKLGFNFTLNAALILNQTITAGVSYIHPAAYGFFGKVSLTPRLKLGYRHELSTSALSLGSSAKGEFLLTYGF